MACQHLLSLTLVPVSASFVLPPQRVSKWWSHEVGGAKFADCFVSAISTSNPIVSEDSSFSIAIILSLASRMACSSYSATWLLTSIKYIIQNCLSFKWRGHSINLRCESSLALERTRVACRSCHSERSLWTLDDVFVEEGVASSWSGKFLKVSIVKDFTWSINCCVTPSCSSPPPPPPGFGICWFEFRHTPLLHQPHHLLLHRPSSLSRV